MASATQWKRGRKWKSKSKSGDHEQRSTLCRTPTEPRDVLGDASCAFAFLQWLRQTLLQMKTHRALRASGADVANDGRSRLVPATGGAASTDDLHRRRTGLVHARPTAIVIFVPGFEWGGDSGNGAA